MQTHPPFIHYHTIGLLFIVDPNSLISGACRSFLRPNTAVQILVPV